MSSDLTPLRADFDAQAGQSLSLPVAGALVWGTVGIAALFFNEQVAAIILVASTGVIFPIALALSHWFGERLFSNTNPLGKLMGLCTLMVNLLWAAHITLLILEPDFLPLTLGIGLGLHWIVFSWIVAHPVGIIHAISRTALVTVLWWIFPDDRVSAVAVGVVLAYLYSIYVLRSRAPNTTV